MCCWYVCVLGSNSDLQLGAPGRACRLYTLLAPSYYVYLVPSVWNCVA